MDKDKLHISRKAKRMRLTLRGEYKDYPFDVIIDKHGKDVNVDVRWKLPCPEIGVEREIEKQIKQEFKDED